MCLSSSIINTTWTASSNYSYIIFEGGSRSRAITELNFATENHGERNPSDTQNMCLLAIQWYNVPFHLV